MVNIKIGVFALLIIELNLYFICDVSEGIAVLKMGSWFECVVQLSLPLILDFGK